MDLVVFDMAQLTFRRLPATSSTSTLQVHAPGVGVLADVELAVTVSDREAVFAALDAVLAEVTLPGLSGVWSTVGLYNPLSRQVAVGAVPHTEVFAADAALVLDPFGATASVRDGVLHLDGRRLLRVEHTGASTARSLAAHGR